MFEISTELKKATGSDPRDLVIVSQPKMGKSSIMAAFTRRYEDSIILSLEKNGYEFLEARVLDLYPEQTTTLYEAYFNYVGWRDRLLEQKGRFKYLLVDVLTELDKFSEIGGTFLYMYKTTVGKNFNVDPKSGEKYSFNHPNFKSVLTLPDGGGYNYTRTWFMEQIELFSLIAPYRIYAAHIADKYIKDNLREEVTGSEIALTGKLKSIFSAKVTTLCKLVADGDDRYLSFDVNNDSIIAGSRAPSLKGRIKISSMKDGQMETYWENIYKQNESR